MTIELAAFILILASSYVLILKRFDIALYVLLVLSTLLHKELFSFYRWDLLPARAFMLALLCAGVTRVYLHFYRNRKELKKALNDAFGFFKQPFIFLISFLWIVRLVSIIFSKNLQSSLLLLGFYTTIVVLGYFLFTFFKDNPEKVVKYLKTYIYIVFVSCLFGYFQFLYYEKTGIIIGSLWNIPGNLSRVGALFWDVNHFGALLSGLLPLLGVLIITQKNIKIKILDSVVFLLSLGTLLLTSSRTAWIIAFISFVVFASMFLVKKIGLKGIGIVVSILVLLSLPLLIEYSKKDSPFRASVKQYLHYRMDSFDSHMLLLKGSFEIFYKYPILGGGYGGFFEHFSKTPTAPVYFGRDPAALNTRVPAHTIWGQTAAETGSIGLLTYSLFMGTILISLFFVSFNNPDNKKYLIAMAMSGVLIGWLTAGIFYSYNAEFFYLIVFMYYMYAFSTIGVSTGIGGILSSFFRKTGAVGLIVAVISLVMIFEGLGSTHLVPWDEAIYAKISKNMVETGNYVVQSWKNGAVWYEKPPLYMWMMTLSMKFLGYSSFAARFPSAIFGILTILSIYIFGKKTKNKTVGFISALSVLTSVHWLYYARTSMLDVTATFVISFSLFIYFIGTNSKKPIYNILSGLLVGLAVMTKGIVGFLPLPIMLFYEIYLILFSRDKSLFSRVKNYLFIVIPAITVSFPWHYEMYRQFGLPFLQNYFGYHVWDRATMEIEDKGKPFFWYITVLKVSMRLWFGALLLALPYSVYKTGKNLYESIKSKIKPGNETNLMVFLVLWALVVFIFFSIAKSKLTWYIMPIYPALGLMIGIFAEKLLQVFLDKINQKENFLVKFMTIFLVVGVVLTYMVSIREMVYTPDLTGSQARLLQEKDRVLGTESMVYIDRMELPLALYYTDSPFMIIDFRPDDSKRVPQVRYSEQLILVTKAGRFSENVSSRNYSPKVIKEDGDWILWYFNSEEHEDQAHLSEIKSQIQKKQLNISNTYGSIDNAPIDVKNEFLRLLDKQQELISKINSNVK